MGNGNLSVLDMVVEKCLFYDVFLKVVFKKHVKYNEKSLFVIFGRKKRINRLLALLLREVRMRIYIYIYMCAFTLFISSF